ncbi:MAG TPA: endolytic transglycosylase MltG [Chthonomonadaceae bacterium]|nr:endolytic transglycosylase MltG [Chthonomonadaceae bacterium]
MSPRTRKRRVRWGLWFLLLLIIGGAAAYLRVRSLFAPATTTHHDINVTVPSGASVGRIGDVLQQKGILRSGFAFKWYVRWHGGAEKIHAGRYTLSSDMTLGQILFALKAGPNSIYGERIRVTIPEGYTLRQVADTLQEKGITNGRKFLQLATDPSAIAEMHADFPLPSHSLEGYLFPDTYYFRPNTPPEHVAAAMLMNFYKRFARPYQSEIAATQGGLEAIVTEASMIEREAKVPQDRPRIAGVIDNRLKRNMPLQIDATVLYALGHHKDRVLDRDLTVNSPYNTYRHKGLPPGPIANPGLAALQAALHPEQNDFLYYVARPNGAHIFTRTSAEHEAARHQVKLEWRQQNRIEVEPGG